MTPAPPLVFPAGLFSGRPLPAFDAALDTLVKQTGFRQAVVGLISGPSVHLVARRGVEATLEPLAGSLLGTIQARGEPLLLPDARAGGRSFLVAGEAVGAFFGLPLVRSDGAVAGCLALMDAAPRELPETATLLLNALVTQLGAQLDLYAALAQEEGQVLATRRQLERADRLATVGKLAAGIAHELGTPLAVIGGRARQLATGALTAEQVPQAARTIADQADRMTAIIRQLMDFARRRDPRPGRFDARLLLHQAQALLEQEARRREVRVELELPPAPRVALFDGNQLMQVLTNLLTNALHASSAGQVVTLTLGEAHVAPPLETGLPEGPYLTIRVKDQGAGIAPEHLARVFEPFFTTKDTGEGTGLGLSVAMGIVRDHEGWIAVESQRGQGSQFTVHLPG